MSSQPPEQAVAQQILTQLPVVLDQVHLGEDVDVGQLHVQHGGQRGAEHRDELPGVCAVVGVHQVHGSQLGSEGTKGHRRSEL